MSRLLGLVVNPIAGMGGRVALKGTDGAEALRTARARGASPVAPQRALRALGRLAEEAPDVRLLAAPGPMGAALAHLRGSLAGIDRAGVAGRQPAAGRLDLQARGAGELGAHRSRGREQPYVRRLFAQPGEGAQRPLGRDRGRAARAGAPQRLGAVRALQRDAPAHAGDRVHHQPEQAGHRKP